MPASMLQRRLPVLDHDEGDGVEAFGDRDEEKTLAVGRVAVAAVGGVELHFKEISGMPASNVEPEALMSTALNFDPLRK
jgi:hypothetical protein